MKHDFPFDPTYGYSQQSLLQVGAPPEPHDFVEFWRSLYATTFSIPPAPTHREIAISNSHRTFEIEYTSLDGFRVGGWLTIPKHTPIRGGVVCSHGYGGRGSSDEGLSRDKSLAFIYPCARGFDRSAHPDWPSHSSPHVIKGIESRDTYSIRDCVADLWAAASALLHIVPEAAQHLTYFGGSFGGGIGALALPWDPRFKRAFLDVPTFGNHPLRVQLQCVGSGESVRTLYKTNPQILNVLRYFDSATAARHISIPVFVAAALFDPAVPPPGQFAVYNAIPSDKRLFVRPFAHFAGPPELDNFHALWRDLPSWLGWTVDTTTPSA